MTKKEKITTKDWTYIGEVKNGMPHGQGILKGDGTKPNDKKDEIKDYKYRYEGSFKNGKFDGKGSIVVKEKPFYSYRLKKRIYNKMYEKYEGSWKNGLRHGEGLSRKSVPNVFLDKYQTRIYSGNWKKNKRFGFGTLYFGLTNYKETISGMWDKNEQCHKGTWTCKSDDQTIEYNGEFRRNNKYAECSNGKGTLKAIDKKLKVYFITKSTFLLRPWKESGKTIITFFEDNKFKKILYIEELTINKMGWVDSPYTDKLRNMPNHPHLKLLKLYDKFWHKYDKVRPFDQ